MFQKGQIGPFGIASCSKRAKDGPFGIASCSKRAKLALLEHIRVLKGPKCCARLSAVFSNNITSRITVFPILTHFSPKLRPIERPAQTAFPSENDSKARSVLRDSIVKIYTSLYMRLNLVKREKQFFEG